MSKLNKITSETTMETFNTTEEVVIEIKKQPAKLFDGSSSVKREACDYQAMTINQKRRELYLAQLGAKDGLISEFMGSSVSFDRYEVLDELSKALGLETNSIRNTWFFPRWSMNTEVSSAKERNAEYTRVASAYGFMKAIATDETLVALRVINQGAFSGRGQNSSSTGKFAHQYDVVMRANGKFLSPYKLEKMIWATREKALSKHNQRISFEEAFDALGITRSTSKAATVATYGKLGLAREFGECRSYKQARACLTKYYLASKEAKGEIFTLNTETEKEFRYGYCMDGSTTIVDSEGNDCYSHKETQERVGLLMWAYSLVEDSPLKKGELKRMEYSKLHDQWELIVASKKTKYGRLDKVKTVLDTVYRLHTTEEVIEGYSLEEVLKLKVTIASSSKES